MKLTEHTISNLPKRRRIEELSISQLNVEDIHISPDEVFRYAIKQIDKQHIIQYTVEPPRSGQSRPNSVRISEFHLVSHAKPVKRTKFLLSEIRTLGRHVYEYHASFYR